MILSGESANKTLFHGWFIVAGCFAATFTLGEAMFTFGVFFNPLEKEFGWSRALLSSGYTVFLIGYGISAIASGRLVDRYNPRPILFVSALSAGLGISLCSLVHSINQLRIFLLIGGLGSGATWSIPTSTVQRWFYQKKGAGLALGIVVAGVGVGGLLFAPLSNYLILSYGWRRAYLIIGVLFFIIIALSSLMIKQRPTGNVVFEKAGKTAANQEGNQPWKMRRITAAPSFAGITFINSVAVLAFHTISVHLVPYATDVRISQAASAAALGLVGGFSVPGRIISGFISDKIGWQKMLTVSFSGMTLSLVLLLLLQGQWMLYCFVFFYAIFHGGRVPAHVGILGEFFGMCFLGELVGITAAVAMAMAAFAPYIAGFIFDVTGSYSMVFMILMALLFSSSIIAHLMKKPGRPVGSHG
jgi:MFS family permease